MIDYTSIDQVTLEASWLTVGVFDGVHRGHQQIVKRLVSGAHAEKLPAVVVTFWPHPAGVLGGGVRCLTTVDERTALLASLGADIVITEEFTSAMADTSAWEFVSRLRDRLRFRRMLIGYDFALGRGREGNAARLSEFGRTLDYEVEIVPAIGDESGVISSTEIRKLVATGAVAEAASLLGHPYSLHGPVVRGDGRGRGLGFPTANIYYPPEKILPLNGVYEGWAFIEGGSHEAAIKVGTRPQFHPDEHRPLVEAFILDIDRDLYGQDLRLDFVKRLRDEVRFPTVADLVEQMTRDVEKSRALLSAVAPHT